MTSDASSSASGVGSAAERRFSWVRVLAGLGFVLSLLLGYWLLEATGAVAILLDGEQLRDAIEALGVWGPVGIIGSMTLAILISPIPSAPIAVAAGAAYGHLWGTAYVAAGSVAGAVAAFGVARLLGHEILRHWLGDRIATGWLGSQSMLMGAVFVSRLLPFISFDIVSYMAGLSVLAFWRFAVATLLGILPASFLLAHFGSELAAGDMHNALFTALIVGGITLVPFLVGAIANRLRASRARSERKRRENGTDG